MKLLDLYCGAGGAGMGLHRAGFEVTGIDINEQPNYPFTFVQADAVSFLKENHQHFDAFWASPPCQAYTWSAARRRGEGYEYPDLVDVTRELLKETGKPYIIENTLGAPLIDPIVLCGTQFNLKVFRHRLFESNVPLNDKGKCSHKGHRVMARRGDGGDFYTVAGHWPGTIKEWQDAMGTCWMTTKHEIAESIPPAYSEFLGKQIIKALGK